MKKPLTIALAFCAAAAAAGAVVLAAKSAGPREIHPVFAEVKWPFLMDQWGLGRAYRCGAEDCGTQVEVYLRPKIGFCNCATGVSDDEELERVADIDLFGPKFSAPGQGREIAVAWMKGRSRPYDVVGRPNGSTLAVAFNDRCDVIVATAVVPSGSVIQVEPAVLAFLNSDTVLRWAEKALGL
jgi:hypothetical protein